LQRRTGDPLGWLPDNTKKLDRIKFFADGVQLLCWDSNATEFYLVDLANAVTQTFVGHVDKVNDVTFFPNDPLILSGSSDRTLRVWSANDAIPQPRYEEQIPAMVRWVRVSPDGEYVVADLEKELLIYKVNTIRASTKPKRKR